MDYNLFREQYDFICLKGLKGEGETWEIQDKKNFRLYDYVEVDLRDEMIDKQKKYCDHLMSLNHEKLLNMKSYTYLFKEDILDDPYCKFYMVFEYSESSLFRELQTLNMKNQLLKPKMFLNLFTSLLSSIEYLHSMSVFHGNIQSNFVCLHDKQGFKLMPNYIKVIKEFKKKKSILDGIDFKKKKVSPSKTNLKPKYQSKKSKSPKIISKIHFSPENYKQTNCRNAFERVEINAFKSEIFSLGMLILQAANLADLSEAYETFNMNFEIIDYQLQRLAFNYGEFFSNILSKMLTKDQNIRITASECLRYLNGSHANSVDSINNILNRKKTLEVALQEINTKRGRGESILLSNFQQSKNIHTQNENDENGDENDYIKLILNTLPQEYQDEIDKYVSLFIKNVEENYQIDSYSDGSRYQGEKVDEKPFGIGIFYWANGERYEGEFREGKYNGYGIYFWPSGNKHYGQFKNGEINGLGVRYYADGGIYFGEWEKGKNHGRGNFFWPNGSRYSGGFINDNIYGRGVLFWPEKDGKTVRRYEGLWKDLEKDGIKVSNIQKKSQEDILTEI